MKSQRKRNGRGEHLDDRTHFWVWSRIDGVRDGSWKRNRKESCPNGVKNVSKMELEMISCGKENVRLAIVDVDVPGEKSEDDLGNGLEESPVVGKK